MLFKIIKKLLYYLLWSPGVTYTVTLLCVPLWDLYYNFAVGKMWFILLWVQNFHNFRIFLVLSNILWRLDLAWSFEQTLSKFLCFLSNAAQTACDLSTSTMRSSTSPWSFCFVFSSEAHFALTASICSSDSCRRWASFFLQNGTFSTEKKKILAFSENGHERSLEWGIWAGRAIYNAVLSGAWGGTALWSAYIDWESMHPSMNCTSVERDQK